MFDSVFGFAISASGSNAANSRNLKHQIAQVTAVVRS
jgi:hypothetical protein